MSWATHIKNLTKLLKGVEYNRQVSINGWPFLLKRDAKNNPLVL
jgi:hypothetical protein